MVTCLSPRISFTELEAVVNGLKKIIDLLDQEARREMSDNLTGRMDPRCP
jgi:hypothetical protein